MLILQISNLATLTICKIDNQEIKISEIYEPDLLKSKLIAVIAFKADYFNSYINIETNNLNLDLTVSSENTESRAVGRKVHLTLARKGRLKISENISTVKI